MSAANKLPTEEQLSCSICLDVFTNPVTLQCGHNFCKNCITQHLNSNSQRQCPMCNERVDRKWKLRVNTDISEMAVQFRQSARSKDRNSSEQQVAEHGQVSCNVPTGTNCFFLVFGLACLTICFTFNMFDVVENAAGSVCPKHGKPLELYCKKEQMPICQSCAESSHRFHHTVPLKEEYEEKTKELQKTVDEIQQKIQERELKIQENKRLVLVCKEAADREMADGVKGFTALIQILEKNQAEVIEMIEAKHKTTEKKEKGFTQELEKEISELTERRTEVEELSRTKDHLHFLQSFPFLNTAPLADPLPDVSISLASYEGLLRTAMETAVDQLRETADEELEKLQEAELKSLWGNALDVTLDPDTAHPNLILSDDGKQVHFSDVWNELPDHSKRFENMYCVLGKQSFSSGRFYYDVQVKGKNAWILGVAKESINRTGDIKLDPENGFWTLFHRSGQYLALTSQRVLLSVNDQIEKVMVFVDYEEGLVSFYDVDAAALIYSFTGFSFTERLYPFFCPGFDDSIPLIISPIN
ncbi:E3 ubiquitin-protein ligase TRIM21-like [Anoplopoma fimbria]|uniref:E3 ubiquitin-protein ligase TRIM21-like n=1 Tax=Anoplopoma fimbria TaxID=229290 RepID=UPI0023ECB81B|nr:E3 ubiquitin-protein ligase TRIM21-like [Anoplopoma fimbria]